MFYVYDVDGIQFQGPLEDLLENRRVEPSRAIRPVKRDEEKGSNQPSGTSAQAIHTYQQIVNRPNMVEPLVHIYQIMSSPVSTIGRDIPLQDGWLMLKNGNIRQLVVTTSTREVVGILSDRDVLRNINIRNGEIVADSGLLVGDVIDEETYTTDSISDIRRVARVMAHYHLDAMPVIENERLAGIVTRGDILRGFADNPKLNLWA